MVGRPAAVPGWATIGGGVALAGVTIYLFIRGSGESSSTAYVVPAQGGGAEPPKQDNVVEADYEIVDEKKGG